MHHVLTLNTSSVILHFSILNLNANCQNLRGFHCKFQTFSLLRWGIWGANMRRLPCKRTSFQIGKSYGKIKTEKQCLSVHSNLKLKYLKIAATKLLQKSEMRKDIVIELSYKGFSRASDYSWSHRNHRWSQIRTPLRYLFVTMPERATNGHG